MSVRKGKIDCLVDCIMYIYKMWDEVDMSSAVGTFREKNDENYNVM